MNSRGCNPRDNGREIDSDPEGVEQHDDGFAGPRSNPSGAISCADCIVSYSLEFREVLFSQKGRDSEKSESSCVFEDFARGVVAAGTHHTSARMGGGAAKI